MGTARPATRMHCFSRYICRCGWLLALWFAAGAQAQTHVGSPCKTPSAECVVVGQLDISVALGVGQRSNPVRDESDIPLVLIPQISYYGKRFFLENLDLGYTLHEDAVNTLNLLGTPGYDRVFFYRDDLQNFFVNAVDINSSLLAPAPVVVEQEYILHRRRTTYLVGPEWLFDTGKVSGQLDALYEVTGEHDGFEIRGALALPLLKPRDDSTGSLTLNAGITWKSAELVRYYYGITGFYDPGAALNPFIKLGYNRALSDRWGLNAFVHYEYLDDAIARSPLISEHSVLTWFAGVVFKVL